MAAKEPTNTRIINELQEIKKTLGQQDSSITELRLDLKQVKEWMLQTKAVEEYRAKQSNGGNGISKVSTGLNQELVKIVMKFLAVLLAILGILGAIVTYITQAN